MCVRVCACACMYACIALTYHINTWDEANLQIKLHFLTLPVRLSGSHAVELTVKNIAVRGSDITCFSENPAYSEHKLNNATIDACIFSLQRLPFSIYSEILAPIPWEFTIT